MIGDIGKAFVEMFEERFGKVLGTILIAIVALAVIGFSLNVIWSTIVTPAWQLWIQIREEPDDTVAVLFRALNFFISVFIFSILLPVTVYGVFRALRDRKANLKELARLKADLEQVKERSQRLSDKSDEIRRLFESDTELTSDLVEELKSSFHKPIDEMSTDELRLLLERLLSKLDARTKKTEEITKQADNLLAEE